MVLPEEDDKSSGQKMNERCSCLFLFARRWEVEQCGDASGGALRAGPLGRMLYLPVPVGRLGAGRDTLYGRLLYAIGGSAAIEMWTRLGAEDWLVKTISRCRT